MGREAEIIAAPAVLNVACYFFPDLVRALYYCLILPAHRSAISEIAMHLRPLRYAFIGLWIYLLIIFVMCMQCTKVWFYDE